MKLFSKLSSAINNLFHPESTTDELAENSITAIHTVRFENKDVLFIDLCWIASDLSKNVWEEHCEEFCKNQRVDLLGYANGLTLDMRTVYKQYVVDTDNGEILGDIQLDSNIIGCFDMAEVLEHVPNLMSFIQSSPVIRNFTGEITFSVAKEYVEDYDDDYDVVTIVGRGTTNFRSEFYEVLVAQGYNLD